MIAEFVGLLRGWVWGRIADVVGRCRWRVLLRVSLMEPDRGCRWEVPSSERDPPKSIYKSLLNMNTFNIHQRPFTPKTFAGGVAKNVAGERRPGCRWWGLIADVAGRCRRRVLPRLRGVPAGCRPQCLWYVAGRCRPMVLPKKRGKIKQTDILSGAHADFSSTNDICW